MKSLRVFITGIGIVSPSGNGVAANLDAVRKGTGALKRITIFPTSNPLPVGEIPDSIQNNIPRTHAIAEIAADEAMINSNGPPDAVVIGCTTGGMPATEGLLKEKNFDRNLYKFHSTGSVAEYIARKTNCKGQVITVSTACSSGALAIKIALEQLRSGKFKSVLAGGVDSLCKLTYYGFNSLQLIDPEGARPLDADRKGMSVAEAAAMLLIVAGNTTPDRVIAEVLGAGLSCDAHHPAAPHPEGIGAVEAINAAFQDSGISALDIDYINLHGTGTIDNDKSEVKAICETFGDKLPEMSSIKGAFGHSLAASGALEAAISALSISEGIIPGNYGFKTPDPDMDISPVQKTVNFKVNKVLSNSFGFGGNNVSVVIGKPEMKRESISYKKPKSLAVLGSACLTGAGGIERTIENWSNNEKCCGLVDSDEITRNLPGRKIRRLKRLPRMTLSLAVQAHDNSGCDENPRSIFFGTGWGPLSETYDFLDKLFESDEQFTSPTDFIGSVHNAPAGQVAIWHKAGGANVTTTGEDCSFEQAAMSALLLAQDKEEILMLIGADEYHEVLSPILDSSAALYQSPCDGGGAVCLRAANSDSGLRINPVFLEYSVNNNGIIEKLIESLGGKDAVDKKFGAIFAGIPTGKREMAENQLEEIKTELSIDIPIIDYRIFTGEFASASAVAAILALKFASVGEVPASICNKSHIDLGKKGILLVNLGDHVSAIEVLP